MEAFKNLGRVIFGLAFVLALSSCGTEVSQRLNDLTDQTGGEQITTPQALNLFFDPPPGEFDGPIEVMVLDDSALSTETYCTDDGSLPTQLSKRYLDPIPLSETTTLICRAFASDFISSGFLEGRFVIGNGRPDSPNPDDYAVLNLEMELIVDGRERLRIQENIMNLIHVNFQRPSNPTVRIRHSDGSPDRENVWELSPYQAEEGISCMDEGSVSQSCVSSDYDLKIPSGVKDSPGFIPLSSIEVFVGRGKVFSPSANTIEIDDQSKSGPSGYWFRFEYWYPKSVENSSER